MTRKVTPTGPGFSDLSTCVPVIPPVDDLTKYRDRRDKALHLSRYNTGAFALPLRSNRRRLSEVRATVSTRRVCETTTD